MIVLAPNEYLNNSLELTTSGRSGKIVVTLGVKCSILEILMRINGKKAKNIAHFSVYSPGELPFRPAFFLLPLNLLFLW
jgi:hypothetical protein